jgi:hypothetical protein
LIVLAAATACGFSISSIDRPLAEFVKHNTKPEWILVAQTLTAFSILVPFIFLLVLVHHHVYTGEQTRSAAVAILCVEIVKVAFCRASVGEYLATGAYGFRYLRE